METRPNRFSALAVLCLVSGFLLILNNLGILKGVWKLWPIFPFFLGLGGVWMFRSGKKTELIALGFGVYIALISIFFFFLNFTTWSHMTRFWPTFIGVFGITLLAISYFANRKRWFILSGLFFVFLSVAFFMVFTINAGLWPVSLILLGVWILLIPERSSGEKRCFDN